MFFLETVCLAILSRLHRALTFPNSQSGPDRGPPWPLPSCSQPAVPPHCPPYTLPVWSPCFPEPYRLLPVAGLQWAAWRTGCKVAFLSGLSENALCWHFQITAPPTPGPLHRPSSPRELPLGFPRPTSLFSLSSQLPVLSLLYSPPPLPQAPGEQSCSAEGSSRLCGGKGSPPSLPSGSSLNPRCTHGAGQVPSRSGSAQLGTAMAITSFLLSALRVLWGGGPLSCSLGLRPGPGFLVLPVSFFQPLPPGLPPICCPSQYRFLPGSLSSPGLGAVLLNELSCVGLRTPRPTPTQVHPVWDRLLWGARPRNLRISVAEAVKARGVGGTWQGWGGGEGNKPWALGEQGD